MDNENKRLTEENIKILRNMPSRGKEGKILTEENLKILRNMQGRRSEKKFNTSISISRRMKEEINEEILYGIFVSRSQAIEYTWLFWKQYEEIIPKIVKASVEETIKNLVKTGKIYDLVK